MKFPEGKERELIQDGIDAWRGQKHESYRYLLEQGLYNAVKPYLPDTSKPLGLMTVLAPILLGVVTDLKRFDKVEAAIWLDDDRDEVRVGTPEKPPEGAIVMPYSLLRRLLELHSYDWMGSKAGEVLLKETKDESHACNGD